MVKSNCYNKSDVSTYSERPPSFIAKILNQSIYELRFLRQQLRKALKMTRIKLVQIRVPSTTYSFRNDMRRIILTEDILTENFLFRYRSVRRDVNEYVETIFKDVTKSRRMR